MISPNFTLQTLSMFLARIVFFRLHDRSILVHAGRLKSFGILQLISRLMAPTALDLDDVDDNLRRL